jgi:hypothetical protein
VEAGGLAAAEGNGLPGQQEVMTGIRIRRSRRAATATVELAVCLPMIVLVTFGGIEGASMIFTKQALVTSAYEGIKVAVHPNATEADVVAATEAVLSERLLHAATVQIEPSDFWDLDRGQPVTVIVSAPGDTNSVFPFGPFSGRTLSASATMVKE